MLACGKITLIILILFVDSFLPLDCRAAIETTEIWPVDNESSRTRFTLKPTRQLLWNNGMSGNTVSSINLQDTGIFFIVVIVFVLLALIIKWCQKCAEDLEETSETTHLPQRTAGISQPPLRTERATNVRQPSLQPAQRDPEFIAAALSHTTMVLFREDRPHEALFIGIENPNYRPSSCNYEQRNDNPAPENELSDLPPSYDTIIQSESRFPTPASGNNSEHSKKDSSSLPLPKDY